MGETQEERIMQYLEESDLPVIGLREVTVLRVNQGGVVPRGDTTARIFQRGNPPVEIPSGSNFAAVDSSGTAKRM
jgi:dipeptidase E